MKSKRPLSREEHELWTHVTKNVKRLKPPPRRSAATEAATAQRPVEAAPKKAARTANTAAKAPTPVKPALKPLVPLEPKAKRRLGRGQADVAARIDLHGMRQHQAHEALIRFIRDAHAHDARLVLVITGKGKTTRNETYIGEGEAGVLRRLAPHWLSEPSLRPVVLGYEAAATRHGGEGAFYVRLRRRSER